MKKSIVFLSIFLTIISCKKKELPVVFTSYDESADIYEQQNHENDRMKYKLIQSKYLDMNEVFKPFENALAYFSEEDYITLKPLIFEKNIPTIQKAISEGKLTYEKLTLFYLYRIRKFESNNNLALHSIITLNPNVVLEARQRDKDKPEDREHSVYGMPILLKDNINTEGMPTTAGAVLLKQNITSDAFIVKRLKENGALILGKTNLSEWAYYFCGYCPSGYSAMGGQTLNPYGRRVLDTGGSSSGSGVTVTSNFCVAAVGSETSGSILSPSSHNSIVGLKPTIGLLSRTGIVPISSTLDTPGPMTKNVIDNVIMLAAMYGFDKSDTHAVNLNWDKNYYTDNFDKKGLIGKRFGAFKRLLKDTLFNKAITKLKELGAEVIEIDEEDFDFPNFMRVLNLDMKKDLPKYLSKYANKSISARSIEDIIDFNHQDSLKRAPYGQRLFKGIAADQGTEQDLERFIDTLMTNARLYFDIPMETHQLDAVLSINNYHARSAAIAKYPALTVPMGYTSRGVPKGLTFIAKPMQEKLLLQWAFNYEEASRERIPPENYD